MTSYKGLRVKRLQDGTIDSVVVEDSTGIELPISEQEYRLRKAKPEIEELPDE